ncbi:MAG: 6,7-dimethyl-8-ribityllumazine synthase [Myxococcota bacterium]
MHSIEVELNGRGLRVAALASRFNHPISHRLLESCLARLEELGCEEVDVIWVPGAFELPLAAQSLARTGCYHALAALGAVIRGDTPHFEYVCGAVAEGLGRVSLDTGVPVAFGVLTTDNVEQALERAAKAGEPGSNKGREAADVAVEMARLVGTLQEGA